MNNISINVYTIDEVPHEEKHTAASKEANTQNYVTKNDERIDNEENQRTPARYVECCIPLILISLRNLRYVFLSI